MRIIETKVYTIEEHPNPEKCYDWIRDNWHDLNEHGLYEFIESLKALQQAIGGELDYSVSQVPDRGEYIRFRGYDREKLMALNRDECPLTGVCYDYDVIDAVRQDYPEKALEAVHRQTEYMYSDEGLYELCVGNDYEFDESGKFHR